MLQLGGAAASIYPSEVPLNTDSTDSLEAVPVFTDSVPLGCDAVSEWPSSLSRVCVCVFSYNRGLCC